MPQICPSPSRQLAAAALAFHRARRKFPKNSGACSCSGDADRSPLQIYPAIVKDGEPVVNNILMEPKPDFNSKTDRSFCSNPRGRGNYASYPSLSSCRTASWSNDGRRDRTGRIIGDSNGVARAEMVCASCGKRNSCSQMTKDRVYDVSKDQEQATRVNDVADSSKIFTATSRRICNRLKAAESRESNQSGIETASKSTHSSSGPKKRKHAKHRRNCIHAGRIRRTGSRSPAKIQGTSQICQIHGYPATWRRSSISRKPQTLKYYNRKASIAGNVRPEEEQEKIYCSDSPTVADFPTKLKTWEHRTQRGSYARDDNTLLRRETILSCRGLEHQRNCPKDQLLNLSRNRQALCKLHSNQAESGVRHLAKKLHVPISDADVCLRPSLIKAAQRKVDSKVRDGGKSHQKKSTWDENLNIINHNDSMSILMDRFRGNDKHHGPKLQNIYELNSVLGSKTSCDEGEPVQSDKTHRGEDSTINQSLLEQFDDAESVETHFLPRKCSSVVNPVTKLGRVANQALRESESHFKALRSRIDRSGISCSPKGTPWRRAF